jgi:NADH-quinone oxidoreductase subunit M
MEVLRDQNWLLSVGTFLPFAGVLVMLFIPKAEEELHKWVALLTAGATLGVGIYTLTQYDYDQSEKLQFFAKTPWIKVISSNYEVGLDGISLPLYVLSMAVTFLVIVYSWNHLPEPRNVKSFFMLMLILQVGMAGTFVAQDLILFFVFFEVVLLPMYFMIGVWGGEDRQYASLKFFLYTMFGSALMLVAFIALFYKVQGAVPDGVEASFSMSFLSEYGGLLGRNAQVWIFAGMFVGFAVKVPMFPFHTWLPDAHTQAPTQGSVILAAILLKLGTYGFVRIAIPMLPDAAEAWAPWIGLLAVIGIIYGALGCLAQTDMKRLIAFSSVAHMGFVMLGIATLTPMGINAAIFGMVAHGLITGMLFFIAGSVKDRYHTLEIKRLSGLLKQIPRMGWLLGFAAMASLGLPGLAGFWGEFPALLASYSPRFHEEVFRVYLVVAALGTVLAAGYLLWLFQRTAFGEPTAEFAGLGADAGDDHGHGHGHGHVTHGHDDSEVLPGTEPATVHSLSAAVNDLDDDHGHGEHEEIHDVGLFEWLAWTPFILGIVVLGIYPQLLFKISDPAVSGLLTKTFGN